MDKITKIIKTASLALGGIAGVFGGFDSLFKVLMACMAIDYISGLITAAFGKSPKSADGKLSSLAGAKGIAKKAMIMLCVLIAALLDTALGEKNIFRTACLMFYIANESLSFIENLDIMGVPFPKAIKKVLSQMQEDKEE